MKISVLTRKTYPRRAGITLLPEVNLYFPSYKYLYKIIVLIDTRIYQDYTISNLNDKKVNLVFHPQEPSQECMGM